MHSSVLVCFYFCATLSQWWKLLHQKIQMELEQHRNAFCVLMLTRNCLAFTSKEENSYKGRLPMLAFSIHRYKHIFMCKYYSSGNKYKYVLYTCLNILLSPNSILPFENLKVKNHSTVYTPCMNTANLQAAKSFRKEKEEKKSVLVIFWFTFSVLAFLFFFY